MKPIFILLTILTLIIPPSPLFSGKHKAKSSGVMLRKNAKLIKVDVEGWPEDGREVEIFYRGLI
jgi:hypothetical protein